MVTTWSVGCDEAGPTYSAMMASIMVLFGLPTIVGSRFVAKRRGEHIDPVPMIVGWVTRSSDTDIPGNTVPPVGYNES